jgi:phosphomevalonate kinase
MFVARAPGKLVALGEYAVLDGAPAVVLALDRYAEASIAPSADALCRLTTRAAAEEQSAFAPGTPSGAGLVDLVAAAAPQLKWTAAIDSQAFFLGNAKLGLGSSAAVLTAWAGAFAAFARAQGVAMPEPRVEELIELHRRFQGGKGSGLDVAASYTGGAITYRLARPDLPQIGSVRLPNSVGFAGIFAGRSASTPGLVAQYRAWRRDRPEEAGALVRRLTALAEAGCAALTGNDAAGWLEAFGAYGQSLQELGEAMGGDIVTAEHREIGVEAGRHGVAYKVSGAGGGDLGLACAADSRRLEAFSQSVADRGFRVINVSLAEHGLRVASAVRGCSDER